MCNYSILMSKSTLFSCPEPLAPLNLSNFQWIRTAQKMAPNIRLKIVRPRSPKIIVVVRWDKSDSHFYSFLQAKTRKISAQLSFAPKIMIFIRVKFTEKPSANNIAIKRNENRNKERKPNCADNRRGFLIFFSKLKV